MIVIVSSKDLGLVEDYDILVVGSLLEATKVVGTISDLIYYESNEDTNEFAANLSVLKGKGVGSLWYVHEESTKDDLVEMAIIGSGGTYISDEFFLEDVDLVKSLVSSKDGNGELVTLGGMGVLNDFLSRYLVGGNDSPIPANYLKVLNNAVNQISEGYSEKSKQLVVLSEKATSVIEDTSIGLRNIQDERANLAKLLEDIKTSVEETTPQVGRGASVSFFPRVSFRKEKDIIRVKDIGRTPYLFSFMLGLQVFCEKVLNRRPRLIVLEPVGKVYEDMYSSYTWITANNQKDSAKYQHSIVMTNYPTQGVLLKLLEDISYDTCIVLDRTSNSKEHLLNCRATRSVHYALSSPSMVDRLGLKKVSPKFKFFSSVVSDPNAEFSIPVLDYPKNRFERENLYLNSCMEMYKLLVKRG